MTDHKLTTFSPGSTARPETSGVGQLSPAYVTPWGKLTLTPHTDPDGGTGGFLATMEGGRVEFGVSFRGDTTTDAAYKRLLGVFAMAYMPDDGLDEALSDLRDAWNFYTERRALLADNPPISTVTRGHGRVTLRISPSAVPHN